MPWLNPRQPAVAAAAPSVVIQQRSETKPGVAAVLSLVIPGAGQMYAGRIGVVARCLFAACAGIEDKANTSVQLINKEGIIVWSYSVNKGRGQKNRQSMAEAIAKHLNDDYLKKQRR